MHPAVILIPVAALILGPRIWVGRVLKQYNHKDEDLQGTAGELAREWLDQHQLQLVKVEVTDIGDHYDSESKVVRLSRDKHDSKTLTAVTTAAHEVSHALQDATEYGPFVWRNRLVKLALTTGQVGAVVLIAGPAANLLAGRSIPPMLIGSTLFAMLGSGMLAQLATLSSELDASFNRALPLLQVDTISGHQVQEAKKILVACSLTYIASSLLSVLNFWPWMRPTAAIQAALVHPSYEQQKTVTEARDLCNQPQRIQQSTPQTGWVRRRRRGKVDRVTRLLGKPLVRVWFQITRS